MEEEAYHGLGGYRLQLGFYPPLSAMQYLFSPPNLTWANIQSDAERAEKFMRETSPRWREVMLDIELGTWEPAYA